ncbi:hypothetical protein [Aurantimonas sp. A3-2-R12]|uniref:hypothetical protein n=1 Tax=Aurantimonas sp. A3-2-R12 TaxID=3114362 RepID=UPI002E198C66|nr:hypothetical protein [Aurantimonas sp. A3-2-R12]
MLAAPFAIVMMIGGPLTFILGVVDTWQSGMSVFLKIVMSLTIDAFLAAIWPITWMIWIVMHLAGNDTPLSTVLRL